MSRISQTFEQLKQAGKKALVPYIVAGDPGIDQTVAMMHQLVSNGADLIELGVPFSDPMAEGVVIQQAHERALEKQTSLKQVLDCVAEFRKTDNRTPIILMGYTNPVENMGYQLFAEQAAAAGIDGLLTVDLPPEEAAELNQYLKQHHIDSVFLISPTTTETRIKAIASYASGYIYYVSLKGVTGAANLDIASVKSKLAEIKQHIQLPVTVGFGIKDGATAKAVADISEGAVVGSALVKNWHQLAQQQKQTSAIQQAAQLIADIRQAMDA